MGEQGPIEAEQPVTADPSSEGPMGYARAAVKVAQMDTETIARLSRDPKAIIYGAITLAITNVVSVLVITAMSGRPTPGVLALGLAPVFGLLASAATTGLVHVGAKVLFSATGTYVGLLRVLWLGSVVSLLVLVPLVGPLIGSIWSLLISMVTFQEVDGIERLQALGLSLGLGAGLYALGALLAR
jgi:hypothetical protein